MSKLRWLLAIAFAVALAPVSILAQDAATITGRVASETGAPIGSAAVRIPSLGIGTVSDDNGTYRLVVPASRIRANQQVQVTVSRVGLSSQTRTVTLNPGATLTQNFQLGADILQLEGLVAVGLGQTTTRERLGVTVATVTAAEVTRVQSPNLVEAMAGKAANVEITSNSGEPGSSAYIRIRGVNTISGSGQPLFVVDGVPIDNSQLNQSLAGVAGPNRASDINPNDVASIEILKGAAASAVYGARAANGVVLVTTKKGQPGQTRASLTSTATIDRVSQGVPLQRSFGQGTNGNASTGHPFSYGPALGSEVETFDHFGEMFRDGHQYDNNLSISGGSERTTYYLSVGRLDHQGTIVGPNNFYNRTTARLKGSHRLTDQISVAGNVAYVETDGSFIQKGSNLSGLLLGALRTPPNFDNRNFKTEPTSAFPNGLHRSYRLQNPTRIIQTRGYDNPFFVVNDHVNESEVGRVYGNINVDYAPVDWFTLAYQIGTDYYADERLTALPQSSSDFPSGRLLRGTSVVQNLDQNLVGTATRDLSSNVGGSLTLGVNRTSRSFRQIEAEGFDIIAPGVNQLENTVTQIPDEFESLIHSESFFAQATADIADQVFLTGAVRNDGFSTFGESERRHWFPKASAAWEFTRTLGFADQNPLSFGKLRAAWGQAGNEPGVYGTITAFASGNVFDGGWGPFLNPTYDGRGGLRTGGLQGQLQLAPERTTEFEAGIDLNFFQDLLGVGFTYYNALTKDAIFETPLAPSVGFQTQLQNAATIRNEGIELTADLIPVQRRNFSWRVGGQFARNNNRVLSLGDSARQFVPMGGAFSGAPGAAVRGERVGVLRGNDFYRCGVGNLPSTIEQGCAGAPAGAVFIAANGFPVLDPEVRVIADPHPDWTAGLRNSFILFENLTIASLVDFKEGGDVWNGTKGALFHFGTHADTERRGTTATYGNFAGVPVSGPGAGKEVLFNQSWFTGLGSGFGPVASQFIEDGSYVKLREVAVSYSLPTSITGRLGMSGIDLKVAGRNLKTWTDYTGIDPETNLAGNTNLRGIDYFNNPQTRSFVFTVNLNR